MRRPRYRGTHPRRFEERYKELGRDPETTAHVIAAGRTPAGSHRPILVAEVLAALAPRPGETAVDATLGFGGHARALLARLRPGGRLLACDVDPIELPKTAAALRAEGWTDAELIVQRSSFAGLPRLLAESGLGAADVLLADLGVSSMQLDDPRRGFSHKNDGPLDLRLNPSHGRPARELLQALGESELAALLRENADEPHAARIAASIRRAGSIETTGALAAAVRQGLDGLSARDRAESEAGALARVFQTLRIAVNDELGALDRLLQSLPDLLAPGGRVTILSFHSGEDRRVKAAFRQGRERGIYAEVCASPIRPSAVERRDNPRSSSAKLRWARRG